MQEGFEGHLIRQVGRCDGAEQQGQGGGDQPGEQGAKAHQGPQPPVDQVKVQTHDDSPDQKCQFFVHEIADYGKVGGKPVVAPGEGDGVDRNNQVSQNFYRHNIILCIKIQSV